MTRKNKPVGFLTVAASALLFIFYPSFIPGALKSLFTVILGGLCARVVYVQIKKKSATTEQK